MNQSIQKTIEVEFCETMLDVQVELFNHDDDVTFEIESATCGAVDILHFIVSLGGLSKLTAVVEKKLKEENFND